MPAKRIILLNRTARDVAAYRYVLWADVPAGNQIAYRNPTASSAYDNATATELQAIRDGLVAERSGTVKASSGTSLATLQTTLESYWTGFQNEVTTESSWAEYGRYWNNVGVWLGSQGVPMWQVQEEVDDLPTFIALTPVSAFAINKFHFVLFNNSAAATSQRYVVKVRLVVVLPGLVAVTGAMPSVWTFRRRDAPTTSPSGGLINLSASDSAHAVPNTITAHSAPTVAPLGGTLTVFNEFVPQADEQKLSTLDAPTMVSFFGGQVIYAASQLRPARPITLRANQTLEVQQSATAGTGNCRVLCVFTVG